MLAFYIREDTIMHRFLRGTTSVVLAVLILLGTLPIGWAGTTALAAEEPAPEEPAPVLSVTADSGGNTISIKRTQQPATIAGRLSIATKGPTLERDYAQTVPVTVKNVSKSVLEYHLVADNPYEDIYLNFVKTGSVQEPLTILPGETQVLEMTVFMQNALSTSYSLPISAYVVTKGVAAKEPESRYNIPFYCNLPDFKVEFTPGAADPNTLATLYTVKNTGEDAITDLTLAVTGDAMDYVRIMPGVENHELAAGDSVTVTLAPDLVKFMEEQIETLSGNLTASSGNRSSSTGISFDTDGQEITLTTMGELIDRFAFYKEAEDAGPHGVPEEWAAEELQKQLEKEALGPDALDLEALDNPADELDLQAAVSPKTWNDVKAWLLSQVGGFYDDDGWFGSQCVDLIRGYYRYAFGINLASVPSAAYAGNAWQFGIEGRALPAAYFTRYQKAQIPNGTLLPGDIVIYPAVTGNTVGHIAIVMEVSGTGYVTMDANYYSGDYIPRNSGPYRDSAGVWHADPVVNNRPIKQFNRSDLSYYAIIRPSFSSPPSGGGRIPDRGGAVTDDISGHQCTNAGQVATSFYAPAPGGLGAAGLFVTGRMYNGSYVNSEQTSYDIYLNSKKVATAQNAGLTEVVMTSLPADSLNYGAMNTLVRDYDTNPGSHFVTADTEITLIYPLETQMAYIGSPDTLADVRMLPDFAVYAENIIAPGDDLVVGEKSRVSVNIYNRGSLGGWVDIEVESDSQLYSEEAVFIPAFGVEPISFDWTPTGNNQIITVTLTNRTDDAQERKSDNNTASRAMPVRTRQVPVIGDPAPDTVYLNVDNLLTADIANTADVTDVTFLVGQEETELAARTARISTGLRASVSLPALAEGVHPVKVCVTYSTGPETTDEVVKSATIEVKALSIDFSVDSQTVANPVFSLHNGRGEIQKYAELTGVAGAYQLPITPDIESQLDSTYLLTSCDAGIILTRLDDLADSTLTLADANAHSLDVRAGGATVDSLRVNNIRVSNTVIYTSARFSAAPVLFSDNIDLAYVQIAFSVGEADSSTGLSVPLVDDAEVNLQQMYRAYQFKLPEETTLRDGSWIDVELTTSLNGTATDTGYPGGWYDSDTQTITTLVTGSELLQHLDGADLVTAWLGAGNALYKVDLTNYSAPMELSTAGYAAVTFSCDAQGKLSLRNVGVYPRTAGTTPLSNYSLYGEELLVPKGTYDLFVIYRLDGVEKTCFLQEVELNADSTLPLVAQNAAEISFTWPQHYTQTSFSYEITKGQWSPSRTIEQNSPIEIPVGSYAVSLSMSDWTSESDSTMYFSIERSVVAKAGDSLEVEIGSAFAGVLTRNSDYTVNGGANEYFIIKNMADASNNLLEYYNASVEEQQLVGYVSFTEKDNPGRVLQVELPNPLSYLNSEGGFNLPVPNVAGEFTYSVILSTDRSVLDEMDSRKQPQTITWEQELAAAVVGDPPVTLSATASSGLAVSFRSSDPDVAAVSGNSLTFVGPGTATITASQAGDKTYAAAPEVEKTVAVAEDPSTAVYRVGLDTDSLVFPNATVGYRPVAAKAVAVSNTGTRATGALTVALSGGDSADFELSALSLDSISVAGSRSVTVKPRDGLSAGQHSARVTVSGANGISAAFDVTFTVVSGGGSTPVGGGSSSSVAASLSATKAEFDKGDGKDLVVTLNAGSHSLQKITVGSYTLVKDVDYTQDGSVITIRAAYLNTLSPGEQVLVFDMSAGADPVLTLTVKEAALQPDGAAQPAHPFTDVDAEAWYSADVQWAYENGLMNGTADNTFDPDATLSRGMIVTILWRMAGSPAAQGEAADGEAFADVEQNDYYRQAAQWARSIGLVNGVGDNQFAPDAAVTRQDLAVMLFRYLTAMGIGLPETEEWLTFADEAEIEDYAMAALQALCKWGIINGTGVDENGQITIDPTGSATRAQIAALLHRIAEKLG